MGKAKRINEWRRKFIGSGECCETCRYASKGVNSVVCRLNGIGSPIKKIFRPLATTCEHWESINILHAWKDGE